MLDRASVVADAIDNGRARYQKLCGSKSRSSGGSGVVLEWQVEPPDFAAGQSTSLIAGVNAVDADVAGVLFLLGDQPGVTSQTIDAELAAFDGDPAAIVMTSWRGKPSHPVLLGRGYFGALRGLTGDTGARPIIAGARDRVRLVDSDRPVPRDVDTEDDYRWLLADDLA